MSEHLEAIIADLDPVRGLSIPEPDLTVARRIRFSTAQEPIRHSVLHGAHRFALRIGAFAASAIAAVVILAVTLVPGGPGPVPVGASEQLHKLATLAADQAPLGPGQYRYSAVVEPVLEAPGPGFVAYFQGTVQTWSAADGSGRQVITPDPTPRFFSPADRAAWVNAGSPAVRSAFPTSPVSFTFSPGQANTTPGRGSPFRALVHTFDVSRLPTDPAALRSEIQAGTLGVPEIDQLGPANGSSPTAGNSCASTACTTFVRTVALLQGPALGTSPALQSAALQALAGTPGVSALGTVTESGRTGSGFALNDVLPARTQACPNGGSVSVPPVSSTYQVVIDPQSGTVAATQVTFAASTVPSCPNLGTASNAPASTQLLPSWSSVVQTGTVNSPTATPGGPSAT